MEHGPKCLQTKLSDQIEYLGIYLDRYLNCHSQSELIIRKQLVCFQMFQNWKLSIMAVKFVFLPISEFIKDEIEKLQKKALQFISVSDLGESSSPLFKE